MRQHHAFRLASRARRVNDRREIIRLRVRNSLIDVTRFALFKLASLFFDLGQRQTFRICDSFRIEENDVLYLRTLAERVSQFLKLLSILKKENAGTRVVQDVTNLRWR